MFIDSELEFCDGETLSGTGIAVKKGDHIDLNATSDLTEHDLGSGEPLYLVLNVTTAFSGGTSVKIDLRSGDADTLTGGGGTFDIHYTTGTIVAADYGDLTGRTIIALPKNVFKYRQYLGIFVSTSGAVTGGVADAFLTKDVSNWTSTATRVPATDPAS